MICKNRLRELLLEGRGVCGRRYFEHCVSHHVKTFYFFCERLASDRTGAAQSSTALNAHIVTQLREQQVDVNNQFNPQGWFGKAWTDWCDQSKYERHFKSEYLDVLLRIGVEPYVYQIRPECLQDVIEIFDEFKVFDEFKNRAITDPTARVEPAR
jgi:hypothetical protein